MVTPIERTYQVRRGDAWEGEGFRVSTTNQTLFDGVVVRSQIREHYGGPLIHEFLISPVVTTEGANKVLAFGIGLTEAESSRLQPKVYLGDIEISSTYLPKSTVVTYTADVFGDITKSNG
jgi:hypothetical protein